MTDEVASTPGLSSGTDQAPSSTSQGIGQSDLSLGGALIYSSGNFGAGIFYALNNFLLPLYLQGLRAPLVLIGLLSSTRSVEGSVIQPLVGAWSDQTWSRLLRGRRRPFIVACVPLSALFLVLTAFVPAVREYAKPLGLDPNTFSLILMTIGIFIFSLSFNIMIDPYTALLADITPVHQRGNVNGLFQMVQAAGQMIVLLLSAAVLFSVFPNQAFFILFLLTAVALVVFFVPTVLGVREPRALVHAAARHRYTWRDYVNGLRGQRQVQLYFLVQFFLWFGISAIAPFLTIFAVDLIGMSKSEATYLPFILLGSTAVFNWPLGILAGRLGLKRVFLLGVMLMAGASVAGIWVRQKELIYAVLLIAGIGNSAQTASSYPLLTRLVRPDRMGLYTGLNSTITSIATPASAALTGLLLDKVGPVGMFPFVAACFLATLPPLALLNVKAGEARVRAELRDAEAQ